MRVLGDAMQMTGLNLRGTDHSPALYMQTNNAMTFHCVVWTVSKRVLILVYPITVIASNFGHI